MNKRLCLGLFFWFVSFVLMGYSASVSPSAVVRGNTVTAYWSGFSGNVNVSVYKGSTFWVDSVVNVGGSGSQPLVTSGWELRNDYRVKVTSRSNTSVYAWSGFFSVSNPSVSLSTTSVEDGNSLTVYWQNFMDNVNVSVYKGSSFWVDAVVNVSGTGSQVLNTSGWDIRSDYRVKVTNRANTSIYRYTSYFSVYSLPPNPPSQYSPSNLEVMINETPYYFDWGTSSGANLYRIYVDNNSGFGSPEINTTTSSTYLYSYSSLPDNVYFWKVQARNSSGAWGDWSSTRQYVVDQPPSPPSLSSPANGVSYTSGSNINFSWSPVSGVNRYYIRIVQGTNLNNAPAYDDELFTTSRNVSTSGWDTGTYTWGIRTIKNAPPGYDQEDYEQAIGWGSYSTRTFTITAPIPGDPNLNMPADYSVYNRNNTASIQFSWYSVQGADEYWLNIFPSGNSANPVYSQSVGSSTTTTIPISSWNQGVYIWQVRAGNTGGWGQYSSSARQFIVDIPPTAPSLSNPQNNADLYLGSDAAFSWSAVEGANRYNIRIVEVTNLNDQPVVNDEPFSTNSLVSTSGWSVGQYTWAIRAIKETPPGYDQNSYEQIISWGAYSSRTFMVNNPIGISQDLAVLPTRMNPSTIFALPPQSEYGYEPPFETEKNFHSMFKITNSGNSTISLEDWGVRVTGGNNVDFRNTYGNSLSLSVTQSSVQFDKRGYLHDNQLINESSTTFTATVQVKIAGAWYDVEGTGNSVSFSVDPRPEITNGMLIKRPRNHYETDDNYSSIYLTQCGKKWYCQSDPLNGLFPDWENEFHVYPFVDVNSLTSPEYPDHDSTIPVITGRNFLYGQPSGEVYIIEPEPNTTTPLKSRWFENEVSFDSYGYPAGSLTSDVIFLSSLQIEWIQQQYPIGSSIKSVRLLSPEYDTTIESASVTLEWDHIPNADHYQVIVDNNPGLGSPEINTSKPPFTNEEGWDNTQNNFTIDTNWLPTNMFFWKVIAHMPDNSTFESDVWRFTYVPVRSPAPVWMPVYRAFKGDTVVDHFYCTSSDHLDTAMSYSPPYIFEKVEGFLSVIPYESLDSSNDLLAVYRFFSPGPDEDNSNERSHYYTTDENERDTRITQGWIYEGIIGYTENHQDFVPMYYLYLNSRTPLSMNDHFYTTSEIEKANAINNGYTDMGVTFPVSLDGQGATLAWRSSQPGAARGVNPANGNFSDYVKSVFSIPGGRMNLDFSFTYNSYMTKLTCPINPLGIGWSHSYSAFLYKGPNRFYVFWPDGRIVIYENAYPYDCKTTGVYEELELLSSNTCTITTKNHTVYTFSSFMGLDNTYFLQSIVDRNNNSLLCEYSDLRLTAVSDRFSRELQFSYCTEPGKTHLIDHITDVTGNRTIYFEYDEQYNLIRFTDAKGNLTHYRYDENHPYDHLLEQIIYPEGNIVENTYQNRKVTGQSIINTGQIFEIGYTEYGASVVENNSQNYTFNYTQDQLRNISNLITPRVVSSMDYSDGDNPTLPTSITDGNTNTTTVTYDSKGNVLDVFRPYGVHHEYMYNEMNDLTQYTDPMNHAYNFQYSNGNLTSSTTPRGTTSHSYDSYGNRLSTTNPVGKTTYFSYDQYDNLSCVTDPLSHSTLFSYDNVSRLVSTTNAKGQNSSFSYDSNNNLTDKDKLGVLTTYSYTDNDDVASISANGQTTSFFYDNNSGYLDHVSNPIGNTTYFDYLPGGQIQSKIKADGDIISFTYDSNGKLSAVSSPSVWGSFTYNNNHDIASVSDNHGSMQLGYDALNRITSVSSSYDFQSTVSYSYDNNCNITSMNYAGHTVHYSYDADNLMRSVQDWNGHTAYFSYRNDGSIHSIQYPNGITCSFEYDDAGSLVNLTNSNINSYTFTLDEIGLITAVEQTEPLGPFPIASHSQHCNYNNANRLISADGNAFAYADDGNMVYREDTNTQYTWDSLDRLTGIDGSENTTFSYDIFGNRRSVTRNGVTTYYLLYINSPMTNVLMEADSNGNPINYYVYANGMLISRIKPTGETRYYHLDFRGSVIAMTNETGQITHMYAYSPYGKVLQMQEEDSNPFRFVGGYGVMDEGNGLSFMRARYYDQGLGRFLSEDPVWNTNLYFYISGNPYGGIDPHGMEEIPIFKIAMEINRIIAAHRSQLISFRHFVNISNFLQAMDNTMDVLSFAVNATKSSINIVNQLINSENLSAAEKTAIITSEMWALGCNGLKEIFIDGPIGARSLLKTIFQAGRYNASGSNKELWLKAEQDFFETFDSMFQDVQGKDLVNYLESQ